VPRPSRGSRATPDVSILERRKSSLGRLLLGRGLLSTIGVRAENRPAFKMSSNTSNQRSTSYLRRIGAAQRRRMFLFVSLMLAYLAQPALALGGMQCSRGDCEQIERCCCGVEALLILAPSMGADEGCCSKKSVDLRGSSEPRAKSECECHLESAPLSTPSPAVPIGALDSTGANSASEWLRTRTVLASHTPSGPLGNQYPPGVCGPGALCPPCAGIGQLPELLPGSGVGAWVLLLRGVSGYLAALSVARL